MKLSLKSAIGIWLLATLLVLFAAVITSGIWLGRDFIVLTWRTYGASTLDMLARQALQSREAGGETALQALSKRDWPAPGTRFALLKLNETTGPGWPDLPRAIYVEQTLHSIPGCVIVEGNLAASTIVAAQNGTLFRFVILLPSALPPLIALKPWNIALRFGLGIVVLSLMSGVLALLLNGPIVRLRQITRRFASGELSARWRPSPARLKVGEFEALGDAFDVMANRIESLMDAQHRLLLDVSHELRTPLTRMTLAIGLARHAAEGNVSMLPSLLDRIEREGELLNRMVHRLLLINRIEADASAIEADRFQIEDLMLEIVSAAEFEASATRKSISYLASGSGTMIGYRDLIASAIENVIRNALRHSPENGEVGIQLNVQAQVRIQVEDQGRGIDPALLDNMFEPFFRAPEARAQFSEGTGLGLTIARRAIVLHQGKISAENRAEGGLRVEIVLPAAAPFI